MSHLWVNGFQMSNSIYADISHFYVIYILYKLSVKLKAFALGDGSLGGQKIRRSDVNEESMDIGMRFLNGSHGGWNGICSC